MASFYHPSQAAAILKDVQRHPALVKALLVADTLFVDALLNLGSLGCRLREELASDPRQANRDLTSFAAQFTNTFHGKLRRLYGGKDFLPFGSLILIEATKALNAALEAQASIRAVLRITGGADAPTQTFVNVSYQP